MLFVTQTKFVKSAKVDNTRRKETKSRKRQH